MVTINLLPWRPLVRRRREKFWRRVAFTTLALSLLTLSLIWILMRNKSSPLPDPLPQQLPRAPSPLYAENLKRLQLQQALTALQQLLHQTNPPMVQLNRILLRPGHIRLDGQADAVSTWFPWLASIQKNALWHVEISEIKNTQGLQFRLVLTVRQSPITRPITADFHAINNHAKVLKKIFQRIPARLVIDSIQLPDAESNIATLRATGSLASLVYVTQTLMQENFFCPITLVQFVRASPLPHLILKWRFPCFAKKQPDSTTFSIKDLRLAGWLKQDKITIAIVRFPDGSTHQITEKNQLGREHATVMQILQNAILLKTTRHCFHLTANGITEENLTCDASR